MIYMATCVFLGSKQLGLSCALAIEKIIGERLSAVITFDDSNDSRSRLREFVSSFSKVPVHVLTKNVELESLLASLQPDLVFVSGWYWIISERVLALPAMGFYGIHPSLLPKYRGFAPLVWGMINGEKTLGFSLFKFTVGVDEGPIYAQRSFVVDDTDYIGDVLEKLERESILCLEECFCPLLQGTLNPQIQNHELATFAAQRLPKDGKIHWGNSQHDIYNFIRAQSRPYPGAYTLYEAEQITVWRASKFIATYYGTPGQLAGFDGERAIIICGDNKALLLEEIVINGATIQQRALFRTLQCRLG